LLVHRACSFRGLVHGHKFLFYSIENWLESSLDDDWDLFLFNTKTHITLVNAIEQLTYVSREIYRHTVPRAENKNSREWLKLKCSTVSTQKPSKHFNDYVFTSFVCGSFYERFALVVVPTLQTTVAE
jgi:hypothetical protein